MVDGEPKQPKDDSSKRCGLKWGDEAGGYSRVSDGLSPVGQAKALGCYPKTRERARTLGAAMV